jgi:hypothetical protein
MLLWGQHNMKVVCFALAIGKIIATSLGMTNYVLFIHPYLTPTITPATVSRRKLPAPEAVPR